MWVAKPVSCLCASRLKEVRRKLRDFAQPEYDKNELGT